MEIMLSSQSSPELAGALMRGKVDVAFLRREDPAPGLTFKLLIKEPLVAVLPLIPTGILLQRCGVGRPRLDRGQARLLDVARGLRARR